MKGFDAGTIGWRGNLQVVMRRLGCYRSAWLSVLLLPMLAGCPSMSEGGRQRLIRAAGLYNQSQYDQAENQLDSLINEFNSTSEVAEAYYLRGLCRTKKGQLKSASEDFERAIAKSERKELTAFSRASQAAIAYGQGDWKRAADLYARAVTDLPDRPPTDQVLYDAGVAMQRAGRWDKAALQFTRICYKFKDRPIAAKAKRMAGWQHDSFAIQLGAFGGRSNAQSAAAGLRGYNFDKLRVEHHPRNGQTLWVVLCGEYKDYNAARTSLGRVRGVQPDAHIVPSP